MSDVLKLSGIAQEFESKFNHCWSQEAEEYFVAYLSQQGITVPLPEVKAFCEKQAQQEAQIQKDISQEAQEDTIVLNQRENSEQSSIATEEFPQGNDPHEWESLESKEDTIVYAEALSEISQQESTKNQEESSKKPYLQEIAKKILQRDLSSMTAEELKVWEDLAAQSPEEKDNSGIDPISAMAIEAKENLNELDFETEAQQDGEKASFYSQKEESKLSHQSAQDSFLFVPPDETVYGTDSEFSLGDRDDDDGMELPAQLATMSEIMICEQLGAIPVQEAEEIKEGISAMELGAEEARESGFAEEIEENKDQDQSSQGESSKNASAKKKKTITEKLEILQKRVERTRSLYEQAKNLARLEKYSQSLEKIERCIKFFPGLKDLEDFKISLQKSKKEKREKQRQKWNLQADKFWEEKRFPEAIGKWRKSLDLKSDTEIQEKITAAENRLQEAMQMWEDAQLLVESNRNEEAIVLLQDCLQIYPYHGSAVELLECLQKRKEQESSKPEQSPQESTVPASEDNIPMDFEKESEDLLFMPEEETPLEIKMQEPAATKKLQNPMQDLMQTQRSSMEKKLSSTRRSTLSSMLEQLHEQREKIRQEKVKKQQEEVPAKNDKIEKQEKAVRQKKQLDKIYQQAMDASKKQNYREALQCLQKILDRQWLCEVPDITGDIQQVKRLLSVQSVSKNAQQKLDAIADSLKFYEIEKAQEMLEDKIFQEELEVSVKKKWQGMVSACMKKANKRAWIRKIIAGTLLLFFILLKLLAFKS
mgnify:CR=1 FL=1